MGQRTRLLTQAVAAFAIAGCGAVQAPTIGAPMATFEPATSTPRPTTSDAPSTVPESAATTAAATTAASISTPKTPTGPTLCGVQTAAAGAKNTSVWQADMTGDGAPDIVSTYVVGAGGADAWHIHIQFVPKAKGDENGQLDFVVADDPSPGTVQILAIPYIGQGVAGSDDDRRPTIIAQVGSGASAKVIGLFRLSGCSIVPVTDPEGGVFGATVGAGVNLGSGLRCDSVPANALIVTVESSPNSGGGFEIVETQYSRRNNGLTVYGAGEQTRVVASLDGTAIGKVACSGGKQV